MLKYWPRLFSLIILLLCSLSRTAYAEVPCHLNLVYKDKGKPGYMAPAPSNEGLYKEVYTEIAHSLGCKLVIKRFPKKRTLLLIKHGEADLYPSTGFDLKRSNFMLYISNGLYRYEPYYGLTPMGVQTLGSISQIKNFGLTWIFEAGDTTRHVAATLGLKREEIVGLTDTRAIEMLKRGRSVFYRIIKGDYESYLNSRQLENLQELNIKTHKDCCQPKSQKLYLGFSRMSQHYAEEPNPSFDPDKKQSAENFPVRISKDSIASQVANELARLQSSGRISKLFKQFILAPGHTP